MKANSGWRISILGGLSAHFWQEDGSSKPGTDYAVSLRNGTEERRILVRIYDDNNAQGPAQQVAAAASFVASLLESGWTPELYRQEPGELVVPRDFRADLVPIRPKPWWRFW